MIISFDEITEQQLDNFKGSTYLRTIEAAVGRAKWDAYLRAYFDRHAFQPQTTAGFRFQLRQEIVIFLCRKIILSPALTA